MNKINFGVMTTYRGSIEDNLKKASSLGLDSLMLTVTPTEDVKNELISSADDIRAMCEHYGVSISALWSSWGNFGLWNFYEGQNTLGLIPIAFRDSRIQLIDNATQIAVSLGIEDVVTHAGFIPENPNDPIYTSFIDMMKYYCGCVFKPRGVWFDFESGQETPVTLRRAIEDIGTGNVGINLDTANVILYGKANPVDAIKVFGDYVRCTHLKDGFFPTDGKALGKHSPIGEGEVDFPEVIRLLNERKYKGHFTIEREISGEQQIKDILAAAKLIRAEAAKYDWDFSVAK